MTVLAELRALARERFFPALSHRDFRLMWLAQTAADSAAWAVITARAWLAFDLAENDPDTMFGPSTWVGMVVFAAMIPYVLVPVFAGLLADRMVRRDLLAWTYVIHILNNLILAILVLTGFIQLWHLLILSFAMGSTMAAQFSAAESLTANLVPRNRLVNAYALANAIFHATRLLGPGVIAPLIGTMDLGWIFALSAGVYVVGLWLLVRIRTRSTGDVQSAHGVFGNLASGFTYAYRHTVLLRVFLLVVFHCSLTMSFESVLPAISETRLEAGGSGVAYMNMMVGLGALMISLVVAPIQSASLRGRLLLITGVVSALSPLALAASPILPLAMLSTVAMGASQAGFMIIASILIQSVVPDRIRGRVTSIYILHAAGIMSFANFANGRLSDAFGPEWVLAVAGLAFLTVMVVSALESTMRRMYVTGESVHAGAVSG